MSLYRGKELCMSARSQPLNDQKGKHDRRPVKRQFSKFLVEFVFALGCNFSKMGNRGDKLSEVFVDKTQFFVQISSFLPLPLILEVCPIVLALIFLNFDIFRHIAMAVAHLTLIFF
jgi:hypothetical protein